MVDTIETIETIEKRHLIELKVYAVYKSLVSSSDSSLAVKAKLQWWKVKRTSSSRKVENNHQFASLTSLLDLPSWASWQIF